MRVLVELLDKEPMENVVGSCIYQPEIVVYLCDERDANLMKQSSVYRLFRHRRMQTKPRFLYLDTLNPKEIMSVLHAVVSDYPNCVFDFSGGKDLLLLVAGAFCSRYGIPHYYIDNNGGRFINLLGCEEMGENFAMPVFSADDIFALTGATIQGSGHFEQNELDEPFEQDVLRVWDIVRKNPKAWGKFVSYLQAACSGTGVTQLEVRAPIKIRSGHESLRAADVLLDKLGKLEILHAAKHKDELVLTFKSAVHKKCLLNQGIWLELYGYVIAKRSGFFDDVRTSVVVDWDGVDGGENSTKNEVDIFLVKGIVPIFISCKMGQPSALALSEIKVLATKFGGGSSRSVVLTADILDKATAQAVSTRAADLKIYLLDANSLAPDTLLQKLKSIAEGAASYGLQ